MLGVARGAEPTRIKAAWRRLARAHHPDLTGDDLRQLVETYQALPRPNGCRVTAGRPAAVRR